MSAMIRVRLGERSYPIWIARDRYASLPRRLATRRLGPVGIIVTNRSAARYAGAAIARRLRAAGWDVSMLLIPDTERAKSPTVAVRLARSIARRARHRTPVLLAVGGGVVGDVAGFVAATFRRGVPYVQVPTTLLAQVDSAIGGKTGVDLPEGKNLLGAFYQPVAVYSDVATLRTLPERQVRSGLGEIIKYAAIADPQLWRRLARRRAAILRAETAELSWIVARCAAMKANIVAQDERETLGVRTLLNFGHTVGHALEAATGYSAALTHGEAIAVGMAVAADLGVALGVTPLIVQQELVRLLVAYGLPVRWPRVCAARVWQALAFDKKFIEGRQRWVFLRDVGHAVVMRDVPAALVRDVLARWVGRRDV